MRAGLAVAVVVVLAVGLYLFQPWRLWTSSTVNEAFPAAEAAVVQTPTPLPTPTPTATPTPAPAALGSVTPTPVPSATPRPVSVELAAGDFTDAEHDTSGRARILELADGRRVLRLENLASSDGPDLHVWLSDAKAGGSWGKYDDNRHVRLGKLKATHGNQNYEIPASADLTAMRSAVIWCDRFNVAFGTAPILVP